MANQAQIADQMLSQLRVYDPSISGAIGTPERMIIDTVAQTLAEAQVDLNVLEGALDVDAKFGTDLDNFLSLFGFGRQKGTRSSGYVTFSRDTVAPADIAISTGTQVIARTASTDGHDVVFMTTTTGILRANTKTVTIPVMSLVAGSETNVGANTITESYQSPIAGVTGITNDYPTMGGDDDESDDEVKARFKATGPFRNLAGTESQYLATAISTLAKKAIVIGPISRHKEYIQVPTYSDDQPDAGGKPGNGLPEQYTTALSFNQNAKYIYDNVPYFIINDANYPPTHYRQDLDYVMNFTGLAKDRGDAHREYLYSLDVDPTSELAANRPNVTFVNVWTGSASSKPETAIAPGDVLLNEYSYLSSASRNDYESGILNCVDVFVNNNDNQTGTTLVPRPGINVPTILFNKDENSAFYIENFRRLDEPEHRPVDGNIFTPLFRQPSLDLPDQIDLSDTTYYKGKHYWAVQDITAIGGTIRARNGVEWSATVRGAASSETGPFTGHYVLQRNIQSALTSVFADVDDFINGATTLTVLSISGGSGATTPVIGMTVSGTGIANGTVITNVSGSVPSMTITLSAATISSASASHLGIPMSFGYPIDSAGATSTIIVPNDQDWPTSGTVTIDNENIAYAGLDTTGTAPSSGTYTTALSTINSIALTGLTRGADSTAPAAHSIGSAVTVKYNDVDSVITISNYFFDNNIPVLQSALDGVKQVTTDVLAHKAKVRYFKPDITVMYDTGINTTQIKESIRASLLNYFETKYFGNTIQLSDVLQVIHNTPGVDNVKWSKDVLSGSTDADGNPRNRFTETNSAGDPISGVVLDKVNFGGTSASGPNKYNIYVTGSPTSGTFEITFGSKVTATIDIAHLLSLANASAACTYIQTQINHAYDPSASSTLVTVSPASDASSSTLVPNSLNQFVITYVSNTITQDLAIANPLFLGGSGAYNTDFVLADNELATIPNGKLVNDILDITTVMTIRVRSQSTWNVE